MASEDYEACAMKTAVIQEIESNEESITPEEANDDSNGNEPQLKKKLCESNAKNHLGKFWHLRLGHVKPIKAKEK